MDNDDIRMDLWYTDDSSIPITDNITTVSKKYVYKSRQLKHSVDPK